MTKLNFAGIAGGLALLMASVLPGAAETVLKVSSPLPPVHTFQKMMEGWAKDLKEKSGGELVLEIYPAGQLGPMNRQFDLAKTGVADIALVISSQTPGRFPMTDLAGQPFTHPSGDESMAKASRRLTELAPQYLAEEYPGAKILWMAVTPPLKLVYNASTPVEKVDQIRGLRVRYAGETPQQILSLLGASPMPVPAPETADSLSKGIIDGAMFPYEAIKAFDIGPMVNHALELGFSSNSFTLVMNQASLDKLTETQRKLIEETTGPAAGETYGKMLDAAEEEGRAYLLDKEVAVGNLPDAEVSRLRDVLSPIAKNAIEKAKISGKPGQAFYDAYVK